MCTDKNIPFVPSVTPRMVSATGTGNHDVAGTLDLQSINYPLLLMILLSSSRMRRPYSSCACAKFLIWKRTHDLYTSYNSHKGQLHICRRWTATCWFRVVSRYVTSACLSLVINTNIHCTYRCLLYVRIRAPVSKPERATYCVAANKYFKTLCPKFDYSLHSATIYRITIHLYVCAEQCSGNDGG